MTTEAPEETEADKELARKFGRKKDGTPRKSRATRGADAQPSANGSTRSTGNTASTRSTAKPATSAPLADTKSFSEWLAQQADERIGQIDLELARLVPLQDEKSRLLAMQEACRQ